MGRQTLCDTAYHYGSTWHTKSVYIQPTERKSITFTVDLMRQFQMSPVHTRVCLKPSFK